jgi:hypothetical protein
MAATASREEVKDRRSVIGRLDNYSAAMLLDSRDSKAKLGNKANRGSKVSKVRMANKVKPANKDSRVSRVKPGSKDREASKDRRLMALGVDPPVAGRTPGTPGDVWLPASEPGVEPTIRASPSKAIGKDCATFRSFGNRWASKTRHLAVIWKT